MTFLPLPGSPLTTPLAALDIHLLTRWLHVLGVALLVGGAVMAWLVIVQMADDGRFGNRTALAVAESYEWMFWGSLGVIVMTGVGNLGVLAPHVPGPGTTWGTAFSVKLLVVVGLLAFSATRTAFVRLLAGRTPATRSALGSAAARWTVQKSLGRAYALTAAILVLALTLAEVLAHG